MLHFYSHWHFPSQQAVPCGVRGRPIAPWGKRHNPPPDQPSPSAWPSLKRVHQNRDGPLEEDAMSDGVREAAGTGVCRGSRQLELIAYWWCFIAVGFPIAISHDFSQFGRAEYGRCLVQLMQCLVFMEPLVCLASWCKDAMHDVPDLCYGKDNLARTLWIPQKPTPRLLPRLCPGPSLARAERDVSRRWGQGKEQSVTGPGHRLRDSDLTVITGLAGGEKHQEDTGSGSLFVVGNPPWQQPAPSLMLFNSTHTYSHFWAVRCSGWVCRAPSSPGVGTSVKLLVSV